MLKIGDFSKKTDTSIETLRYYDQIDLLKPAYIDIFTNYRYYDEKQIDDLKIIKDTIIQAFFKREGINAEGSATMPEFMGTEEQKEK